MPDEGGFSCTVTGFEGFQQEILRLRNANRERPETLDYLNWRYRSGGAAPEPRVFWLLHPSGERVGMASAIFRPYRLDGEPVSTAVIGDISVDARWRGRGLGQLLLRFMTEYLDKHYPTLPAFVIPTEAARRTLASIGWVTPGALVPYVCVLDATRYLRATLRSRRLAAIVASGLKSIVRAMARRRTAPEGALFLSNARDERDLDLAISGPRAAGMVRDLGPGQLRWRYAQHPHACFVFGRYYRADALRGLVVFEDDPQTQTCSVYDLSARDPTELRSMLALLVLRGLAAELTSLRIVLNDRHPLVACVRGLGFIARAADSVFQVHSRSGRAEKATWYVTHGDKDT